MLLAISGMLPSFPEFRAAISGTLLTFGFEYLNYKIWNQ
ncbi:unnamed protein product, partial [Rotaria magnacalcarata]